MTLDFITRVEAETLTEKLRSLAQPARLMILACLAEGERSVGDLERLLDVKQPALSQQLAELRQAGWVASRRQSKAVIYRLAAPHLGMLLAALGDLLSGQVPSQLLVTPAAHETPKPAASVSQAAVFAVTGSRAGS